MNKKEVILCDMENIELVLRDKSNLNSFTGVQYVVPSDVNYASFAFEEDAYFRVGLLTLNVNTFY